MMWDEASRKIVYRMMAAAVLWGVALSFSVSGFFEHQASARFDFFMNSTGDILPVQFETWFREHRSLKVGDRVTAIAGNNLDQIDLASFLASTEPGTNLNVEWISEGDQKSEWLTLKRHSRQSVLTLFVIPLVLSVLLFGLSMMLLMQRALLRLNAEATLVFAGLCLVASLLFLGIFPSLTFFIQFHFSWAIPLLSVLFAHLFATYPKAKGLPWIRQAALLMGYSMALALTLWLVFGSSPLRYRFLLPLGILSFVFSISLLVNTLFTSKDFWARRRARILSVMVFVTVVMAVTAFFAFLWEGPYVSIERILGASLLFPAAFSIVFLKSNVFDLERLFRKGLHQLGLFLVSILFAVLLGIGWTGWRKDSEEDWVLWVAIVMVVLLAARPLSLWISARVHQWVRTKVGYPDVNAIFEKSVGLADFLTQFCRQCESALAMREMGFRLASDPSSPWATGNEEIWVYRGGRVLRGNYPRKSSITQSYLLRGDTAMGEFFFRDSDSLAFDPRTSSEWNEVVRRLARCVELFMLRELMATRQSFLAVGRVQALLAHEMKNPLAIIRVCAGLLQTSKAEDQRELVQTIQAEVDRVSRNLQGIFEHSRKAEKKDQVAFLPLLSEVSDYALTRFSDRQVLGLNEVSDVVLSIEREGLRQSLLNMIVNSFEAGSRSVHISTQMHDQNLELIISDEGPGLPEGIDIFEPFVTTKSSGTGLGLATVRIFAEAHGGWVRAENRTEKRGAVFSLILPRSIVVSKGSE
jgi:signal transduction histidine kinase